MIDGRNISLNETVFVSASVPIGHFELFTNEEVIELSLVYESFRILTAVVTFDLQVREEDSKMHLAARYGKDAQVNIIVFETVLADERHCYSAAWTIDLLVTVLFSWLTVLLGDGKVS